MADCFCYAYAEDSPSCSVIRKLIEFQNMHSASERALRLKAGFPENKHGASNLKKMMPNVYNMVKAGITVFILTDLDSVECPTELQRRWFGMHTNLLEVPDGFLFRIAVREVESWLIADRDALACFLGLPKANFSKDPDSLNDPKAHLLTLIKTKCKRKIYRDMLPGRNSKIGHEYNSMLCKFISKDWNPERAADNSLSLRRALEALKKF